MKKIKVLSHDLSKSPKKFFKSKTFFAIAIVCIITIAFSILISNFMASQANIGRKNATVAEVKQAYLDILERPADEEGLNHFLKYPIDAVRAGLMASNERKSLEAQHVAETTVKQSETTELTPVHTPIPIQTTQPAGNTASSSAVSPSNTYVYKPYIASVCTQTAIPYKIEYKDVSYLNVGETSVGFSGSDGYIKTCTTDSNGYKPADFTIEPINRTVYVGTTPAGPTQAELDWARQLRIANCIKYIKSVSSGSSAYMQCYSIN